LKNTLAHVSHETEILHCFSSQTDGQTEVVNSSVGNLLRTLVGEHTKSLDFKLTTAEFAYNTTMNRTTCKLPHEIVYGFRSRQFIDLILMSDHIRASNSASLFASHVYDFYKKVMNKIV